MILSDTLKSGLIGSMVLFTSVMSANANLPKNSLDLARWAEVANIQSKARAAQPKPVYSNYTQPVYYNPYASQQIASAQSRAVGGPLGSRALMGPKNYPLGAANFSCVKQAAYDHQVPLRFMLAINSIERGRYNQKVANKGNVSYDLGQFQINTIHLPMLSRYGASEYDLLNRGCYNAQAAAFLLSNALKEPSKRHLDIFTRAAGYHSWTPKYNAIYKQKLIVYLKQWDVWLKANNILSDGRLV